VNRLIGKKSKANRKSCFTFEGALEVILVTEIDGCGRENTEELQMTAVIVG
jgi:hypothetical protein